MRLQAGNELGASQPPAANPPQGLAGGPLPVPAWAVAGVAGVIVLAALGTLLARARRRHRRPR